MITKCFVPRSQPYARQSRTLNRFTRHPSSNPEPQGIQIQYINPNAQIPKSPNPIPSLNPQPLNPDRRDCRGTGPLVSEGSDATMVQVEVNVPRPELLACEELGVFLSCL